MANLGFLIPVTYNYSGSSLLQKAAHFIEENVDAYFFLGGKRVYLILKNENGNQCAKTSDGKYFANIETDDRASFRKCMIDAAKIVSRFTLIIPAFLMAGKLLFRYAHHYYPLEVTIEHGRLSARQEHFFNAFSPEISVDSIEVSSKSKLNLLSMLSDKALNKKCGVYPDPDIEAHTSTGTIEYVREIGEKFFKSVNRIKKLTINNERVIDVGFPKILKKPYVTSSKKYKGMRNNYRKEKVQKVFQRLESDLIYKITAWVHPSFNLKIINEIFTKLYSTLSKKVAEAPIFSFSDDQVYEYEIRTDEENLQLEGKCYLAINDMMPLQNQSNFTDWNKYDPKAPMTIGYLGIYQRIFVPKKELIEYKSGKGLPNLKVDVVITPLSKNLKESESRMIQSIRQLPPNFNRW
jgi:hypothetical protein